MKSCISGLCTGPFTRPGNSHFASLAPALTGPRQGYRLQKTSFHILVGIYCHDIPTHTPQSGYHGVTEVAKTANIAKMAGKCIHCMSARPTPLIQTPWSWDPEIPFRLKIGKKTKRFMIFDAKKRGGSSFDPPPSLKSSKKWVSIRGGLGGSGPKTHWGMCLLDKIMILQGVQLTIQPLGVGYANRPKKAQNGGYVAFSPIYACLALI